MKRIRFALILVVVLAILPFPGIAQEKPAQAPAAVKAEPAAPPAPRPIELKDILAWKSATGTALSADGSWVAYRLAPAEGNAEVVFRQTQGTKEYRFPAGDGRMGRVDVSDDGKFGAFLSTPDSQEARKLRKERKPLPTKAVVVNLANGEKVEVEKVKAFSFSGETPGWIALHKTAPEAQEREKDKWTGSDLILRELGTGKELALGNVAEFAFNKKGRWLAVIIDAYGMSGNGVQLRDMTSGTVLPLDTDKASYKRLGWTEKGDALACLKGKEDKAFEDKLFAVVGFTGFGAAAGIQKAVYDPQGDKAFPAGMAVSADRAPSWSESLDALFFGIREPKKKEEGAGAGAAAGPAGAGSGAAPDEDIPDLVLWHGGDPRLQSQQQVEAGRDQSFTFLCAYRVKEKKFLRLADAEVRYVEPAPKERWAIGYDDRTYELDGNLDGRRYQDLYIIDLVTGARKPALKKNRWSFASSPAGTHFLYYDDGVFYALEFATGKTWPLTKATPADFTNEDNDINVKNPPDYPLGWTKGGLSVLLTDGWDIWNVPLSGAAGVNLTVNGRKDQVRTQRRFRLDPEEKGVDLAKPQYFGIYGEWTKKAGISRLLPGKPGAQTLLWEDAGFGALVKAKNAEIYLYQKDTYRDCPALYAADAQLQNGRKLTDANPQQKDFLWSSGQILLDYKMDPKSGLDRKLQAALFLPANYEKGKRYPTVVYYYEKMSQQLNRYAMPSANGFNKSVYTSNGYAVLMPDITYTINDPGMSAVWCVLPALDAAVAAGVVDRSKVGLQGHSWGGYQTAFLVTQADFAAAVAGAPLTNMISMYSSIYFNTGTGNMAIFESSQGRFQGGYWDNLEAYQRNSPVYWAARVKTPLLILHNDKDGAVVWNQGIEYYSTLRRMKKPVAMLQYVGENHGLAKPANQKDYTVRMKEWFDHYLKGAPAPAWMTEGIPHLKMKDHLKERSKLWKPEEKKPAEVKEPEKKEAVQEPVKK